MIRVEDRGAVRILTLDRPDKANALTADMLEALVRGVQEAEGRVLVLTGTGKVFSAGADLDAAREGLALSPLWEELSGAIAGFPGLTIAALNGTVAGGAMGMFLACDLRISVPGAKVFYPVMKLGFLPQPSDPGRLAAIAGLSLARRILMAGEKIAVEEALARGLVDKLVAPEVLIDEAIALGADTAAAPPEIASGIKALLRGI
jgi:enoyl-CoA hydratase